ncbi:unnamed protein product, partial [Staurois parvus]
MLIIVINTVTVYNFGTDHCINVTGDVRLPSSLLQSHYKSLITAISSIRNNSSIYTIVCRHYNFHATNQYTLIGIF